MEKRDALRGEENWGKLDLKTFFAVLSLMRPEVKQADIARDIGITPATLSRIINGTYGDGKVRWEWISALKPYLMSIDTKAFSEAWCVIEELHDFYAVEEYHEIVRQFVSQRKGDVWQYNNNWRKSNSMLFYGEGDQVWFMFDVTNQQEPMLQMKEIVSKNKGYISLENETYFTFLCYSVDVFDKCVEYLNSVLVDSHLAQKGVKFSVIWVDTEQRLFKEEYHLYLNE